VKVLDVVVEAFAARLPIATVPLSTTVFGELLVTVAVAPVRAEDPF
jgi:hypothetical protein